jgi:hypothetical protein
LVKEALEWSEELKKAQANPTSYDDVDQDGTLLADGVQFTQGLIGDRTEEIAQREGGERASAFSAMAHGQGHADRTPHRPMDVGTSDKAATEDRLSSRRQQVRPLVGRDKLSAAVEVVTKKTAGA